jgi:hypothetical protein
MPKDYSNQNLQKASFINEDLSNTRFTDTDLRGADFSGSDLSGADLTHVKTGITPANTVWIFLVALAVSLLAGYIAMLAGQTVQAMLASTDKYVRTTGYLSIILNVLFIGYAWWKGGRSAIRHLFLPAIICAFLLGVVFKLSGLGTGQGMWYLVLALVLMMIMFIVGTIARAAAGALSNILFLIVALSGGIFGKSIGGGIGTTVVAIACMQISKRALSGAKGFESLRKIASFITKRYGTSFRNSRLANANLSESNIRNADFSDADIALVNWGDSKKKNCVIDNELKNE